MVICGVVDGVCFTSSPLLPVKSSQKTSSQYTGRTTARILVSNPTIVAAEYKFQTARIITSDAATGAKYLVNICDAACINTPNRRNNGIVPNVKAKRMLADINGFPNSRACAIIACVVPQGRKMVNAPTTKGANQSSCFDCVRASLIKNLGG